MAIRLCRPVAVWHARRQTLHAVDPPVGVPRVGGWDAKRKSVEAMVPDGQLTEAVTRAIVPQSIASWKRVERGYTPAQRWVAHLRNGSSVFVKAATNDMTAEWLRAEHLIYSQVDASYLPRMLGWNDDGARPVLILEDLSQALWPPPWSDSLVKAVLATLSEVRATSPPSGIPVLNANMLNGWSIVASDPGPFLALRICAAEWLDEALPLLLEAERTAPTAGDQLVHLDVRSDNMCFSNGRMVLVDWNHACCSNGLLDVAAWLPSLRGRRRPGA